MKERKTAGSCPICSSTWLRTISETESLFHGHGKRSRSKTRSGSHVAYLSTFKNPSILFVPHPRLSRVAAVCTAGGALRCCCGLFLVRVSMTVPLSHVTPAEALQSAGERRHDAAPVAWPWLPEQPHCRIPVGLVIGKSPT